VPNIKLTDQFGLDVEIKPSDDSGFTRYLRDPLQLRAALANLQHLTQRNLRDIGLDKATIGFTAAEDADLGGARLKIAASASATLALFREPGAKLLEASYDLDPLRVPPDMAYLKAAIDFSVTPGVTAPAVQLGFEVAQKITLANYRLFPDTNQFGDSLQRTFSAFVIPKSYEDLLALPAHAIVTSAGAGSLKVSVTAPIPITPNPLVLAEVALPALGQAIAVNAGGKFTVGASFLLKGEYEIRAARRGDATLVLGYFKRDTTGNALTLSGSIGVAVQAGERDLFSSIVGALSTNPVKDLKSLPPAVTAGLDKAIKEGVRHRLEIALSAELKALNSQESAFLYEITPAACDDAAKSAITSALDGDLTGMDAGHPGIRKLRTVLTTLEEKRRTLRLNLLGIYNYISLSSLALKSEMFYEESTGQLVLTVRDTATAKRFRAGLDSFRIDAKVLRKVLAESFQATVAYHGGAMLDASPTLRISHTYFELLRKTSRQDMKDNLDAGEALGLITPAQIAQILAEVTDFGRTTFLLETRYGPQAAMRLFIDPPNGPRSFDTYAKAGREALARLVQPGDAHQFRRAIANDPIWQAYSEHAHSSTAWKNIRGAGIENEVHAATVRSDYLMIVWWATAMENAAAELARMRQLIESNPAIDLEGEPFTKQRKLVAGKLKEVAKETRESWQDPWGLIAMALVLDEPVEAHLQILGPSLDRRFARPAAQGQVA
jgi:hypothetical protein